MMIPRAEFAELRLRVPYPSSVPSDEQNSPPSSTEAALDVLRKLANDFERSLTPIVDSSLAELAEVAFAQGTMNPYDIRNAVVPPSTGHYVHVCLNVTAHHIHGGVKLELVTEAGTRLSTETRELAAPQMAPRRPRPIGLVSLIFAVPSEVDWGAVAGARLSFVNATVR